MLPRGSSGELKRTGDTAGDEVTDVQIGELSKKRPWMISVASFRHSPSHLLYFILMIYVIPRATGRDNHQIAALFTMRTTVWQYLIRIFQGRYVYWTQPPTFVYIYYWLSHNAYSLSPAEFHDISMHYEHIFWLAEADLVPPAAHEYEILCIMRE